MALTELKESYNINQYGIIENAGKFEGCMYYMPYFWDMFLNGGYDSIDDDYIYFNLNDDDKKMFPELEEYQQLVIYENENGFVYGNLL